MSVLDKFKENNKVEEIKFISTNTFLMINLTNIYLLEKTKKKSKKIGYESNCD